MTTLFRLVAASLSAALLAACGNLAFTSPPFSGLPSHREAPKSTGLRASRSWMDFRAQSGDLLYVADQAYAVVYVYSYPHARLVGELTGFADPTGACVDAKGDVFIANYNASDIIEYAHGGTKPKAVLSDSGHPYGCSVNGLNGDLAVSNWTQKGSQSGEIAVYTAAKGKPKLLADPNFNYVLFDSYDKLGNLFVDSISHDGVFLYSELPKGSSKFKDISLDKHVNYPGGVQWDGIHMAIENVGPSENDIYRSTGGKVIGTTHLDGSCDALDFFIEGGITIVSDPSCNKIRLYHYPSGGHAITTITLPSQSAPIGVVVSPTATP